MSKNKSTFHQKKKKPGNHNKKFDADNEEEAGGAVGEGGEGRRRKLPETTLEYYRRVSDTWQSEFHQSDTNNHEDRELFLDNVFTQMSSEAAAISKSQTVSRVVETMLKSANETHSTRFWAAIETDIGDLATDMAGCHVLQTLIDSLFVHFMKPESEVSLEAITNLEHQVLTFGQLILADLDVYIRNTHSVHIVRSIIQILGGAQVSQQLNRDNSRFKKSGGAIVQSDLELGEIRPLFKDMFLRYVDAIFNKNNIRNVKSYVFNMPGNPVLQTILLVLKKYLPDKCEETVEFVLELPELFTQTRTIKITSDYTITLPEVFSHNTASFLIEKLLIDLTNTKQFNHLIKLYIQEKVLEMATCPTANFILQKILTRVDSSQLSDMMKKLKKHIEDIMSQGHTGVILQLTAACTRLHCNEDKILRALLKVFHCYEPAERQVKILPLIASLQTFETFYKMEEEQKDTQSKDDIPPAAPLLRVINLQGALIVQKLLQFSNPQSVVDSFLDMKPVDLKTLSCDAKGSHVFDAFFSSSTISRSSKDKMFKKLESLYASMAVDKFGSRVIDALWNNATLQQKTRIVELLSKGSSSQLKTSFFGRLIFNKTKCDVFLANRQKWEQLQREENKKRKMLDDIFTDDQTSASKRKKKKKKNKS
ncbi:nucleolar protein 9-like [Tubulanus polymorphus]|uniref:nucleolar protein 9-like n=1 Tax=Tubulanus polymorphus TaxID=672921 RepID=UPI003DA55D60